MATSKMPAGAASAAPDPAREPVFIPEVFRTMMRDVAAGGRVRISAAERAVIDAALEGDDLIEFRQRVRQNDIYIEDR